MAKIVFQRWRQTAVFHNPLKEGNLDSQDIEARVDPLTGHQSFFNKAIEGKISVLYPHTDRDYLHQRAEAAREKCFLCGDRWKTVTPRFSEKLVPEGRLARGEVILFPNLFPLAAYHAVVRLGDVHFRSLDNLPPSLLRDALLVTLEFIKRCHEADSSGLFFTINANYLFPAGASAIHPHFQIVGSPRPGTHHEMLLERSRAYLEKQGTCYWNDLAESEREEGERIIGELGRSLWFSAYAPMGANEVNALWPDVSHFLEWDETDVERLAEGLSKALRAYHAMNFSTFNFSCFSGPLGKETPGFRIFLRFVNRQNVYPHHRTDDYFFQKLLKNEIIIQRPEALAGLVRQQFESKE